MNQIQKRGRVIYLILGMCLIALIAGLVYDSGICPGLSLRADRLKVYARASRDGDTILPGDIYDRNGKVLAATRSQDAETDRKERRTEYSDGKAYSQLLGYTGAQILNPLADSADQVVIGRDDYRLMGFLDEDYWGNNGLYAAADPDATKGQSAVLTIDDGIQKMVYNVLASCMDEDNSKGSAVVMDVKSGQILAMVAFPSYDFNNLAEARKKMEEDEEKTDLEPSFPVSYKNPEAPGSIFKIVTAVSLIDHGMEDFTVTDLPFEVNGWRCNNSYYSTGDTKNYADAIEYSSNVFFARAAMKLGKDRLNETAEKFLLTQKEDGQGGSELKFDFGSVPFNWDLNVPEDVFAQTGFGQGRTELTTVHAAMITQAIANNGTMLKPYLVSSLQESDGTVVYEGKTETLSKVTTKKTADKITRAMQNAAYHTCIAYPGLGDTLDVFSKYEVAGKTGTAENGDENRTNNAWFISFAPADDPQYVVVVNQCQCSKSGYAMAPAAAAIYEHLFEEDH